VRAAPRNSGVTEKRSIPTASRILARDVAATDAARAPSVRAALAWLALGCAAAGLAASGCNPERSRGSPVTSVRVEPARAARVAEPAGTGGPVTKGPGTNGSITDGTATRGRSPRDSGPRGSVARGSGARPSGVVRPAGGDVIPDRRSRGSHFPDGPGERPAPLDPSSDPTATATAELEPGASEEFDEDILLDIDEALAAVDENAFAMLFKKVQVVVDGELVRKEKFAHPDNCRRWRSLRTRGYAPKSALGKQIDAGALVRCGALEFLARARPSRVTHVRKLLVGAGPSALPAAVASATSPLAEQARDRAVARGASLAEFLPNARTTPSELPGRLSITEPSSESSVILNAEAWGDINADGVEDLVLSVLNTADDGTYYAMRLLQVTRLSPSSPLSVLAVLE
jgi:hypothetical protein